MAKLVTLTRKIELRFNVTDAAERNSHYGTLKRWRDVACNGANMVISAMYANLKGEGVAFIEKKLRSLTDKPFEFEALEEKIKKAQLKADDKEIYKEIEAEKREAYETSEVNYYYRLLAAYYAAANVPTAILSCLANHVSKDFINDKSDYLRHNQSLRNYKKNMPMPFTAASIRNVRKSYDAEKDQEYKDFAFTLFGLPFRTNFGRDKSNNYVIMSRALSAHFLPQIIDDSEERFNQLIMAAREACVDEEDDIVHHLGDIDLSISYMQRGKDSHQYNLVATIGNKTYEFVMRPMKPKKVAGSDITVIPGYKIASDYKLCDSKIQVREEQYDNNAGGKSERTKLFLLASIQFEAKAWDLDPNKAAYCELDPETPIKVIIGKKTVKIGSKEEFEYRRLGIQGAYRQTQINLKYTNGGRGRGHKLQALAKYNRYEKDVVKDKIHNYTSQVIKYCLDNNCKHIYLRIPKKPTDNKTDEEKFLIRNWSYGQTQTMLEYKAGVVGIEVATVEESED